MLVNIFFLSSVFSLTQEHFQNPNLNYLFWTFNLTHTLLNASNPQLAKDCWIPVLAPPSPEGAVGACVTTDLDSSPFIYVMLSWWPRG